MRGEKIQELREERGYSREYLADRLYITVAILQSWEEGWYLVPPSSGEIEEMSEAFGMDEDEFRELIDQDECDDYDDDEGLSFAGVLDTAVRLRSVLKDRRG